MWPMACDIINNAHTGLYIFMHAYHGLHACLCFCKMCSPEDHGIICSFFHQQLVTKPAETSIANIGTLASQEAKKHMALMQGPTGQLHI